MDWSWLETFADGLRWFGEEAWKHMKKDFVACASALGTVGAAIFAYRAFRSQSKQLRQLEEDRIYAALVSAPRFEVAADRSCDLGDWVSVNARTLLLPKLCTDRDEYDYDRVVDRFSDSDRPVWFIVTNVRYSNILRAIHVVSENGKISPIDMRRVGRDIFAISYDEKLARCKKVVRLKIYFETESGVEGVHTYETVCGRLDFRRIWPPSVIDNAGIQFASNAGEKQDQD